jgi:hypothetical protein
LGSQIWGISEIVGHQMSAAAADHASTKSVKRRSWSFLKGGLTLTVLGAVGTGLISLLQLQSTYQDKVAAVAKDDLTVATQTFTEASSALSLPILLQQRLIYDFYNANNPNSKKSDPGKVPDFTSDAHDVSAGYLTAYTALNENYAQLAQKAQLYLDWASDPLHDPAASIKTADPISIALLGDFDFDCDNNMPAFDQSPLSIKKGGKTLNIDWYSTKHHVLTMVYCLRVTHQGLATVRQWASAQAAVDKTQIDEANTRRDLFEYRSTYNVSRLNSFMNLAMSRIEEFRTRYQPHNFYCVLPFMRC